MLLEVILKAFENYLAQFRHMLENDVVKCLSERNLVNFTSDGEYSSLSERTLSLEPRHN